VSATVRKSQVCAFELAAKSINPQQAVKIWVKIRLKVMRQINPIEANPPSILP
jgi:hypothetical protein